jgi:hypothetical protein
MITQQRPRAATSDKRRAALRTWCAVASVLALTSGCSKLMHFDDTGVPWNAAVANAVHRQVREITLAEQHDILTRQIHEGLTHPLQSPYFLVGVLGCALWSVAYVLLLRQGLRDRIHTVPLLAICLNFTWEAMAVLVLPDPNPIWSVLEWSWLTIDVGLLALLLRYGRAHQLIAEIKRNFFWIVPGLLVLCFIAQLTFVLSFGDLQGFIVAFMINLIMSVLFVFLYFDRSADLRGLNYPAAWLKMLGTACTSVQCAQLLPLIRPDIPSWGWLNFMYITIFAFDALYVLLLHRRRLTLSQ